MICAVTDVSLSHWPWLCTRSGTILVYVRQCLYSAQTLRRTYSLSFHHNASASLDKWIRPSLWNRAWCAVLSVTCRVWSLAHCFLAISHRRSTKDWVFNISSIKCWKNTSTMVRRHLLSPLLIVATELFCRTSSSLCLLDGLMA